MTISEYKTYFNSAYKGAVDFDKNILTPILGKISLSGSSTNYALDTDCRDVAKKANIKVITDVGEYSLGGDPIRFFDVTMKDNSNLTVARVNIRNVVTKLWKENYSGAIIVFHYDNDAETTWRFSWVERRKSGKDSTPGKRYTYLCGPSYSCRTIAQRFDELQKTSSKTLDSITKAFDVEALSDEFFYNYRALYSKLLGDGEKGKSKYKRYKDMVSIPDNELGFCDFIERHKGDTRYFGTEFNLWSEKSRRDYIKKLMGRLVFLQFLQKKGWMGVPAGDN